MMGKMRLSVAGADTSLVRKWDWNGSITQTLRGHTDYVYTAVVGNHGTILSCGEDHTAVSRCPVFWLTIAAGLEWYVAACTMADPDDGSNETILHPCQTVWTVCGLDNGDIITGGSDGIIRVWTKAEERFAEPAEREVSQACGRKI
jgi:phospholipase A-2-activating protein